MLNFIISNNDNHFNINFGNSLERFILRSDLLTNNSGTLSILGKIILIISIFCKFVSLVILSKQIFANSTAKFCNNAILNGVEGVK